MDDCSSETFIHFMDSIDTRPVSAKQGSLGNVSMNNILELILIAVMSVAGFTVLYRLLPYKEHETIKPKFTFFPKYVAGFNIPVTEIESTLAASNFEQKNDGIWSRGKVYGDFSANSIKLSVQIDRDNNQIKVYASSFGILFDTGDLWQVTTEILKQ